MRRHECRLCEKSLEALSRQGTALPHECVSHVGRLEDMNYYGGKELADSFRTVRKNTITVAEEIGEQHYGFVGLTYV
jgi:hypothetical protein